MHPTSGDLWVANLEARNLVRFEPALRGHAIDSRVTRITTGPVATVTPIDLNAGVDYTVLPNPAALATALAEPFGVAVDGVTERVYVAAHGTPNYERMEGNPICRQIPWDDDAEATERLAAWRDARTGYPWIDACMTQLREEVTPPPAPCSN